VNELHAGIDFPFAVLPEPSALFQPSEGASDDPAFGQHYKGMQFIAFDDLNGGFQAILYAISEGLADVTAVEYYSCTCFRLEKGDKYPDLKIPL